MNNFGVPPVELVSGQGAVVTDADGKQYLDLLGGIAVNALGHAHPAIVQAVSEQVATLGHVSNFFTHPTVLALWPSGCWTSAERDDNGRVIFCNSGAEANEAAFKMARLHRPAADDRRRGRLPRPHHGRAGADRSAGQAGAVRADAGRRGIRSLRRHRGPAGRRRRHRRRGLPGADPGRGRGGPRPRRLPGRGPEITAEHGALLVIDEVQTGIGRTGTWFAPTSVRHRARTSSRWPRVSAAGCRSAPPSASATRRSLLQPGQHGSTFAGNPVCAAAALAVLRTIETDGLLDHVDALGKHIATGVEDLGHPLVDHVRGAGLLLGIVLTENVGPATALAARDAGFIINAPAPDVLRLAPPLILTTEQADSFVAALPGILDTATGEDRA